MSGIPPTADQQQRDLIQAALNAAVPVIAFNGFAHQHTAVDFMSVLTIGPRPVMSLMMSPVVAKSFATALLEAISNYEAAAGVKIETITDLNTRLTAYAAAHGPTEAGP
jgi:hypothetical protein